MRIRTYAGREDGEAAVRRGEVDVLVVDGQHLAWRRQADDELRAVVVTVLLFTAITTYGNLVLTGVVEEKASRVVEVGYFASFASLGRPESSFARLVSLFPPTAPLAMPNRIAMGGTAWWEPVAAALLTVATVAGLGQLGGRVYANAILHTGPRLSLRWAWRAPAGRAGGAGDGSQGQAHQVGSAPSTHPSVNLRKVE